MRILISNDDGVNARGLEILYRYFSKLGQVKVVAPADEKSTTGHSLTLHKPLRVTKVHHGFYSVNGSPADCVYIGVKEIFKRKPDLVLSGINRGANLGQDIYYSGTVSAAREAAMMGIPAFAVSLAVNFQKPPPEEKLNFSAAGRIAVNIFKKLKKEKNFGLPKKTLLNINVPDRAYSRIKGPVLAHQGFRHYSESVLKRRDHRGREYFWVGGQYRGFVKESGTDCLAGHLGYATITPVQLDATDYSALHDYLGTWERFHAR